MLLFRERHPERHKEMTRRSYETQKAKLREASRLYREAHPRPHNETRRNEIGVPRVEAAKKRRQWLWENHEVSLERFRKNYYKSREKSPWLVSLQSAKARCKKSGIEFSLTFGWARVRWTGRCELTDIPFVLNLGHGPGTFSPSIDRIDPAGGYTPDNCRFILYPINAMKGAGTEADMLMIAKAIVDRLSPK